MNNIVCGGRGAQVISCVQGRVPLEEVFGSKAHAMVSGLNIEGHHRGAVAAARSQAQGAPQPQVRMTPHLTRIKSHPLTRPPLMAEQSVITSPS